MNFDNYIQDIYEECIEIFNETIPLRPTTLSPDVENSVRINHQIASHIHNIRRHLELQDFEEDLVPPLPLPILRYLSTSFVPGVVPIDTARIRVLGEMPPINNLEDVKITLSPTEFEKLEKIVISNDNLPEYEIKECNVCITSYQNQDKLVKLPCNHVFHEDCIKHWLCTENVKCPVCRHDSRI